MPDLTVSIDRLTVGASTDQWSLDCVSPTQPVTVDMTDKDTGVKYRVGVCYNPSAGFCDDGGLGDVLAGAGYIVWDEPCP